MDTNSPDVVSSLFVPVSIVQRPYAARSTVHMPTKTVVVVVVVIVVEEIVNVEAEKYRENLQCRSNK